MRLVTRSDFDGLACAVLLSEIGTIDSWKFVHPKDLQDGLVEITRNDVLTNVPYVPGCGLWFDHHSSELERVPEKDFEGLFEVAPSCARVVWKYYGGHKMFRTDLDNMLVAVDKLDSADLSVQEILQPDGWVLLGYIMDPRTGLGRYRHFRISNYKLMEHMIGYCRVFPVEEILELPDVSERVDLYYEQSELFSNMLDEKAQLDGNVVMLDLREQEEIYTGNRFTVYAKYPDINVSIQIMKGFQGGRTVVSVGKSIVNRSSKVDIGSLMLRHGGGGHEAAGTCQLDPENADAIIKEIVAELKD